MNFTKMTQSEFVREISIAENLGIFLGAGASASSGIPTAYEMTLDFKRRLFASEKGIDLHLIYQRPYEYEDEIEQWVRIKYRTDIENEYGFFFERCFPSKEARNRYIREILQNSQPSIGYEILAVLVKNGLFPKIFTTNFDNLVQKVLPDCVEITENNIDNHKQILKSSAVPVIFKLHGDFREDWLRNLPDETRKLHEELEKVVITHMKVLKGLVIIGYSGRDRSVIKMLREVLKEKDAFPYGIFWCARHGKVNESVCELLNYGIENGLKVSIVEINDFDGLMVEIYKQLPLEDISIKKLLGQRSKPRAFSVDVKSNRRRFIVHNFMPILEYPKHFWVMDKNLVSIQRWEDLDTISEKSNYQIILSFFRRDKIIALGDESLIKTHLGVSELEPYSITIGDLKALNRGSGFLLGIYHRIFIYHFENFIGLRSKDKHTVVDEKNEGQVNGIKFFHALRYHIRIVEGQPYLVIQPDYIVIGAGSYDEKMAKNILLGYYKNRDYFEHLRMWHKKLKKFGNGDHIYIYGPPEKTVRFVVGSKFMKSLEVLKNE